ncbi:MAG: type II toxin-antitoxin system RelE/ParE family toxin [Proteobacteria bacterium]|nr:MAG: type II toxin-antitoxin system RelE/ParE family toxin [Pseudomonadota bacterium]
MAQIVWTEPALIDLDEIAEYIALDKPTAAQHLVQKVFSKVKRLAQSPDSGKKPAEFTTNTRYREVVVKPCRIFYRVQGEKVYIVYVMRSERLLRRYMLGDDI